MPRTKRLDLKVYRTSSLIEFCSCDAEERNEMMKQLLVAALAVGALSLAACGSDNAGPNSSGPIGGGPSSGSVQVEQR